MSSSSLAPSSASKDFITSLSGRYNELQDANTLSHRFTSYIYSRKLLIRKSIEGDPLYHLIYCTHCTRLP